MFVGERSGAICAIEPQGSSQPVAVRRLHESGRPIPYLDAFNCLPRLESMLERDMDSDLCGPDTPFGDGYPLRERNAMVTG